MVDTSLMYICIFILSCIDMLFLSSQETYEFRFVRVQKYDS